MDLARRPSRRPIITRLINAYRQSSIPRIQKIGSRRPRRQGIEAEIEARKQASAVIIAEQAAGTPP